MELYDIASKAFNPFSQSVLTGFNQGQQARTQQMQNASMALQSQRDQAMQAIAPELGQAFANSGMPLGDVWGKLVQANPNLAQTGLREAMDYEQDKLRKQQLMILQKPEVQAVLANIRDDILTLQQIQRDVTSGLSRDKVVEQASLYQLAENELLFAKQELAKYGANASMIDQNVPKFTPFMTLFKDILSAEQQVESGKRAQTKLSMDEELFPFQKQNLISQTKLNEAQAADVGRSTTAKGQADMDKYTSVMDTMAMTAKQLVDLVKDIDSGDPQLAKSAKASITKLVSRAASNEALSEADFARAAGAENWKAAVDNFLKTDFAQMTDAQAKKEAKALYDKAQAIYNISSDRAKNVSGGARVIALPFPFGMGSTQITPSPTTNKSTNQPQGPKKSIKEIKRF